MPRLFLNRFFTIPCFILAVVAFSTNSIAKSAVAISENGQDYGYCFDLEDKTEAEKCAMHYCNQSATKCKTAVTCEESGFGVVFQNYTGEPGKGIAISPKNSVTVAICGQETTINVRDTAEISCKKTSKEKNPTLGLVYCFEKAFWYDTIQIKSREHTEEADDKWCDYATELSGISSYNDCLKSLRFPNPKEDCKQKARIWC